MNAEVQEQQTQEQQTQNQETQTQETQKPETQEQTQATLAPPKQKNLFPVIVGIVAVVILALASVSIYAYNTPENRLARLLDLGERYLSELNYEQAAVTFQAALEIDPKCLPAYAGGIEAYIGLGDAAALQEFYQTAVNTMVSMEPEELAADMELTVEIFLQADTVYADDVEMAASVLEQAYELTDENEDVGDALVEDYEIMADSSRESGDTDRELDIYDRILEIQPDNEDIRHKRSERVREYLEQLIEEGNLDKAEELIKRYKDVIEDVDFEEFQNRIDTLKETIAARESLLLQVYALMEAEDYTAMAEIDGADETNTVVEALEGMPGIYAPEGFTENYTGIAVGVYPFGEGGYNFYYGEYVDGVRSGQGVSFISGSLYYTLYDGTWLNDAPNGEGTVNGYQRQYEEEEFGSYYIVITTGTFTNGLYDGEFTRTLTDNYNTGLSFSGTFTADMGQVSDVYDQYPQYHDHGYELDRQHQEGSIIYVFMENTTDSNWDDWLWWSYISPGEKLSIPGFSDSE